jgi:hypothetical protein
MAATKADVHLDKSHMQESSSHWTWGALCREGEIRVAECMMNCVCLPVAVTLAISERQRERIS